MGGIFKKLLRCKEERDSMKMSLLENKTLKVLTAVVMFVAKKNYYDVRRKE